MSDNEDIKINEEIKGISIVWLSKTDLTNLNSGEGESNYIDIKKYKRNDIEYPYVSGQAMRYYLKEAIQRDLNDNEYICVPNEKGETCGNIKKCISCDLFGFMTTIKDVGSLTRTSPVKVSPAIGLLPFDKNFNVDFLTRKHMTAKGEKAEADIVNVELATNIYKCGISIDLVHIGAEETIDNENRKIKIKSLIKDSEKLNRISKILDVLRYITEYSKQARLLTDFTPDIIVISFLTKFSHRLQKIFDLNEDGNLNLMRFEEILKDISPYCKRVIFGMTSGIISNENDFREKLKINKFKIYTPGEAIKNAVNFIKDNFKEKNN